MQIFLTTFDYFVPVDVFIVWCNICFSEISNFGGIEALINTLADARQEVVANAACCLTNMATEETLRSDAQNRSVVTKLIEPLKSM